MVLSLFEHLGKEGANVFSGPDHVYVAPRKASQRI